MLQAEGFNQKVINKLNGTSHLLNNKYNMSLLEIILYATDILAVTAARAQPGVTAALCDFLLLYRL